MYNCSKPEVEFDSTFSSIIAFTPFCFVEIAHFYCVKHFRPRNSIKLVTGTSFRRQCVESIVKKTIDMLSKDNQTSEAGSIEVKIKAYG